MNSQISMIVSIVKEMNEESKRKQLVYKDLRRIFAEKFDVTPYAAMTYDAKFFLFGTQLYWEFSVFFS